MDGKRCEFYSCKVRRLWADCVGAQADLSLLGRTCQKARFVTLKLKCMSNDAALEKKTWLYIVLCYTEYV